MRGCMPCTQSCAGREQCELLTAVHVAPFILPPPGVCYSQLVHLFSILCSGTSHETDQDRIFTWWELAQVVKNQPADAGSPDSIPRSWRCCFNPWVSKIIWRRKWKPTAVFLPGKFHRQKSLVGYSPWRSQRVLHDWAHTNLTIPELHFCFCFLTREPITEHLSDATASSIPHWSLGQ